MRGCGAQVMNSSSDAILLDRLGSLGVNIDDGSASFPIAPQV